MKKLTHRLERVARKAAEVRERVESVPDNVREVRAALATAAGQAQVLRAEFQNSIAALRADDETQLVAALRELDGSAPFLAEAGMCIETVDMDISVNRRLIVRLGKTEDVAPARLRALQQAKGGGRIAQTLLAAIIRAEELARTAGLTHLTYRTLTVEIGLVPSVRLGWQAPSEEAAPALPTPLSAVPPPLPSSATPPAAGWFPPPVTPAAAIVPPPVSTPAPPAQPAAAVTTAAAASVATTKATTVGAAWNASALERFKKMPALAKHPR